MKNAPNGVFTAKGHQKKCPIHKNGAFFKFYCLLLTKENAPCLKNANLSEKGIKNARLATPLTPPSPLSASQCVNPSVAYAIYCVTRDRGKRPPSRLRWRASSKKFHAHGFIFFFLSGKREGNRSLRPVGFASNPVIPNL